MTKDITNSQNVAILSSYPQHVLVEKPLLIGVTPGESQIYISFYTFSTYQNMLVKENFMDITNIVEKGFEVRN